MSTESKSIDLPGDIVEGLRRLDKSVAVLTPAVDRRVANAAAAHFEHRPDTVRPKKRRWAVAGALAASLAVGVFLVRTQTDMEPAMLANDIDGSGVVDILDAFALARMSDGAASQAQIDALIGDIVALNGTSP